MLSFRDDLKARCSELPWDTFDRLHEQVLAAVVPVSRPADFSPIAKLPRKFRNSLQAGLRRTLELTEGVITTFNAELLVPTFVQARAVLETGSLLLDASCRVQKVVDDCDKVALSDLDDFAMKMVLGVKSDAAGGDPCAYAAVNVVTTVSRVAKNEGKEVTEVFEFLSEYAHPNFWGLLGAYSEIDGKTGEVRFIDRPFGTYEQDWPFAILGATLGLSFTADAVKQFDARLVSFVALCEAKIHDDGNWPPGLPYPRPCSA